MIARYLTQAAIWKRRAGLNRNGQSTYAPDLTIACRWEWKRRRVRNATGDEVISEARVFTTAPVTLGDSLVDPDGRLWNVVAVTPQYALGGRELYREVML